MTERRSRGQDRIVSDTAIAFAGSNPILLKGEIGIEIDTGRQKYGDGVTAWDTLPYNTVREGDVKAPIDSLQVVAADIQSKVTTQRDVGTQLLALQQQANSLLQQILVKLDAPKV